MLNACQNGRPMIAASDVRNILFVDSAVDSASRLLAGLHPGFEAVQLPESGDPVAAIALHLAGRRDIAALHILSHGAPGALSLSGQRIDAAALAARPALTAAIRDALSGDAEIVLYGCSVAQGQHGEAFVDALSALLDRPVAASAHPVGATRLGGGWDIPARTPLAFDAAARAAYPATLAKMTFGIVTTINTTTTLTASESGVTVDVVRSDGAPMAGVSSGFLDAGVIPNTTTYTLTFGSAINITQFQIGEFKNNTASGNYVFTPSTGTTLTLADDSGTIAGSIATLTPTGWDGVTSFTVSYSGAVDWQVGLDNIEFTSAVTTAASTSAGGFDTTDGTNLTPALTFVGNDETLTIADASHITATSVANGGAGTDTIVLATGSDLSTAGFTLTGFETVTLAANASVTMTEAQHDAFATINGNTGTEQITLATADGNGLVTGDADIETYVLGTGGFTFTLGAAAQNVTGSSGVDTVDVGTLTATGTLNGAGGTDTLSLGNGASIAGATVSNFENLTLASGSTTTLAASQLSQFSGTITAAGTETVNVTGDGAFTTLANVETYSVGDDTTNARTITVGQAGTNVTATTANDANTFNLGTLTYTGTVTGEGTTDDILSLGTGANIAGGTITAVEALTLASGASVTMTTAQLEAFTGTVTAAGAETVTLTTTGTVTNAGLSAIETVATAADTAAQTITMSAALAAGKTLTAGDASLDHFVITGSAGAQTIKGSGGADTIDGGSGSDVLSGGAGNDVISGGSGDDTISGGAGHDVISGGDGFDVLIGGAGNDTFTSSSGNFNGDTISDFAIGDSIVVTGSDLSSLNGTAASGTIAISGSVATTLTGVSSASGTFSAVFAGGNTTITLVAPVVVDSGGGSSSGSSGSSGSSSGGSTIIVTPTTSALSTNTSSQTITNTGSTSGSAAIVENSGNNNNVVTATLPGSVSISSEGPAAAQSGQGAVDTLVGAVIGRSSTAQTSLVSGAQTFLKKLASTSTLDVRTLVPTTTSTTLGDPIIITGTASSGQSEAFVIDVRSLPSGSTLQLDNIEFASVIGSATVNGGSGDNYVTGDDNSQFISLGVGDDTLYGGAGADTIGSGSGIDDLYGEEGDDLVFGGTDADNVYGGDDQDVVYGNQAADVIYGNAGVDTLYGGQDNDVLYGGQHQDVLYGNFGDDTMYGNLGADTMFGGLGDDVLYGGQNEGSYLSPDAVEILYGGLGNDTLYGGIGNDMLYGEAGNDLIIGGDGEDVIVVQAGGGADTVSDFAGGSGDRIQIEANVNDTSIDTFAELQAASANNADGNVVISLGGDNTLTLNGVTAADLQSDWFFFT